MGVHSNKQDNESKYRWHLDANVTGTQCNWSMKDLNTIWSWGVDRSTVNNTENDKFTCQHMTDSVSLSAFVTSFEAPGQVW